MIAYTQKEKGRRQNDRDQAWNRERRLRNQIRIAGEPARIAEREANKEAKKEAKKAEKAVKKAEDEAKRAKKRMKVEAKDARYREMVSCVPFIAH